MLSVRGIYDGRRIKTLKKFCMPPNVDVIVTFIETKPSNQPNDHKTQELLELFGTWEDDRPAEDIIKDIYQNRTSNQKEINL